MRQAIFFAVRLETENELRRMLNYAVVRAAEARQRAAVEKALKAANLRRLPLVLDDQSDNLFKVTLIRVSAGTTDDDSIRGACKTARDCVAAWLGLDDGRKQIRFIYKQQKGPMLFYGLWIIIEDKTLGPDITREIGDGLPTREQLGEPQEHPSEGESLPKTAKRKKNARQAEPLVQRQPALPLLRCYAAFPWDQKGSGQEAIITELPHLDGDSPPKWIEARSPEKPGAPMYRVRMEGRRVVLPAPFGECFLYEKEKGISHGNLG